MVITLSWMGFFATVGVIATIAFLIFVIWLFYVACSFS